MAISFIKAAIKNPKITGAIAPSSSDLAREMMRYWPSGGKKVIVEFGPGTGSFTKKIEERRLDEKIIAIELNPTFAEMIERDFPDIEVHADSAESLRSILEEGKHGKADLILSGLPWAAIEFDIQKSILANTYESLGEGGVFSTFAYLHALKMPRARDFAKLINETFPRVETSKVIWRNIPPAIIYHCFK